MKPTLANDAMHKAAKSAHTRCLNTIDMMETAGRSLGCAMEKRMTLTSGVIGTA